MKFGCEKILQATLQGISPVAQRFFLFESLFYPNATAVADRAHFRPAFADHAYDWPTITKLRPRPEFQLEFGVDGSTVALDRQVEITLRRQIQNDIAAKADKLIMPALVKPASKKHSAAVRFCRYIFAVNIIQRDRAADSVRLYAAFGIADLDRAANGFGSSAFAGAANDNIAAGRLCRDIPARVRDRDRIGIVCSDHISAHVVDSDAPVRSVRADSPADALKLNGAAGGSNRRVIAKPARADVAIRAARIER